MSQLKSVTINPVHRAISLLTACVAVLVVAFYHDCPRMELHLDWLRAYAGVEVAVLAMTASLVYLAPAMDASWGTRGFFLLILLSAAMQGAVTLYGASLFCGVCLHCLGRDWSLDCSMAIMNAGIGLVFYHVIFFFISLFYRPFAYEWASPEEAETLEKVEWKVSAWLAA
jgi:hypothetical protein